MWDSLINNKPLIMEYIRINKIGSHELVDYEVCEIDDEYVVLKYTIVYKADILLKNKMTLNKSELIRLDRNHKINILL